VTLRDRDRQILMVLVPVALIAAFWFLLLAPKREEAKESKATLQKAHERHDRASETASAGASARATFESDYVGVVRLGKAVPVGPDVASLIVQLEAASRGTGVRFDRVKVGRRASAQPSTSTAGAAAGPSQQGSTSSSGGSAGSGSSGASQGGSSSGAGGSQAATGAGQARNTAQGAANGASQRATANSDAPSGAGGQSAAGGQGAPKSGAAGLDSVPVEFTFKGGFFDLADMLHRVKRLVRMANGRLVVTGRLLVVDTLVFDVQNGLHTDLKATIYLAPRAEGPTAGATPAGPSTVSTGAPPAAAGAQSSTPAPPAAVVSR